MMLWQLLTKLHAMVKPGEKIVIPPAGMNSTVYILHKHNGMRYEFTGFEVNRNGDIYLYADKEDRGDIASY